MKKVEALSILNLQSGTVTPEDIKTAYRKAAFKYHPDRNPAGLEMMKLINAAYDLIKDFTGTVDEQRDFGEILNKVLNAIIHLNLNIEVCGSWIWVSGDTKPHAPILKAAGYRWAPHKKTWYFRDEANRSRNKGTIWSMEKIRETYGQQIVEGKRRQQLAAA